MKQRIRLVELRDAPAVRGIYAPFVLAGNTSFESELPDVPGFEERFRKLAEQYPWLVFEAEGEVVGYAYASPHRARKAYQWSVEVSVYIKEGARHRGVGRAMYRCLFFLLHRQGYVNAYAGIALPNPGSVGLHQAMGFTPIGVFSRIGFKFGQWHDVQWMQLRLSDPQEPVSQPHPVKTVLDAEAESIFTQQAHAVRLGENRDS